MERLMVRLQSHVLSIAVLNVFWRKRLIGSKSNAASISAQACGNVDNENGTRLQMDPKTVERRESKVVQREDKVE
jgi:hypothetical protein